MLCFIHSPEVLIGCAIFCSVLEKNPEVSMDVVVHMTQLMTPAQRAEVVRILSTLETTDPPEPVNKWCNVSHLWCNNCEHMTWLWWLILVRLISLPAPLGRKICLQHVENVCMHACVNAYVYQVPVCLRWMSRKINESVHTYERYVCVWREPLHTFLESYMCGCFLGRIR